MASSDAFINNLKNKLICSICHDIFINPKTLPCLHSYCTQCIAQSYEENGDQVNMKMECPKCKTTIDVPDGDPSKLRSSFYLDCLLKLFQAMKSNADLGLSDCGRCEKPKVLVAFCPQCEGFICEKCIKTHKRIKQLRNKHQAKKFVEFKEENVKSFIENEMVCKEKLHEEEKLLYFCQEEECRRCVCQKCLASNHQNHQLQSLAEAAEDGRKDIQESINRAKQLKETFEEELEKSKKSKEKSRQEFDLGKKEVLRAEEMLCRMVRDHSTAMISALEQKLQEQTTANDQEQLCIENGIEQLSSFMQQWQDLQDKGVLYDIIESKDDHKAICKTLLETPPSFVAGESVQRDLTTRYMTAEEVMQSVISKIARTIMPDPSQCTFASLKNVCHTFENDFYIITRNTEGEVCPTRIESIDVRIKDVEGKEVEKKVSEEQTGKYRVSYKAEKAGRYEILVNIEGERIENSPLNVDILDVNELFKPVKIFGRKGCGRGELNSPQSIAVSDNGEIAIVDSLNHRIQIFRRDGTYLRDFGSKGKGEGKLFFPFGVVFNDDRIIVSDGSHDDVKLKEFDLNGTYVRTFNTPEELLVGHGMCCNDNKNIAVCCRGNGELDIKPSIKVFSKQGDLGHEFDMPDNNEQPEYITYGNGKYFVSCDQDFVRVFDVNGVFLYKFGEKGERDGQFNGVRGLAVYGPDMILVCDGYNHRVQLFTQEGEFIRSFGSYGGPCVGCMNRPIDVIATADAQVYVLEFESSRVQIWK